VTARSGRSVCVEPAEGRVAVRLSAWSKLDLRLACAVTAVGGQVTPTPPSLRQCGDAL
jgi:hypothetical protein